jgi:hypothetical protein
VSNVFATRENLVTVEKIDDCFPIQGVKLHINLDSMLPGDFVVRSVVAGSRRKIEVLAAHDENGFDNLLSSLTETRQFTDRSLIEFASGQSLVSLPDACLIAAPKGL